MRRSLVVILLMAALAAVRPAAIVAQDAPMRWDGSIERLSSTADFGWPESGAARMSRHALSEDGRWLVFSIDDPNSSSAASQQVFKRDRLFGGVQALFAAAAAAPPALSADGNHLAVELCDGVWRTDGAAICDVHVLNHSLGMFFNASTSLDGADSNAASSEPMLSRDGRFLVFKTLASTLLPPGATPGQIVLRDRDADGNGVFDEQNGVTIQVVSVSSGGEPGNGESGAPEISADGRFVAFRSAASNLVADDTNGAWDVFLHDRQTGETRRINVGWDGQEATPTVDSPAISMTPDGNLIAFAADDAYLTNPPTAAIDDNGALDVLVYDRTAGTLERIDIGVYGTLGNGHTHRPTLSSDGRYVSMLSAASNIEEPSTVTPGRAHAYVYDRATARVTRVSATADGSEPDADTVDALISHDGSFVAFTSSAANLAPGTASFPAIYGAGYLDAQPAAVTIPARGGEVTLTISAQQYVNWFAELSDNTWLSVAGMPWGSGPGMLTLSAYSNPDPAARSVTVRLGARTVLVTQDAGLSLGSVSPVSGPPAGGTPLTLTGTGFEPDMVVFVDGTPTPVEFVSATSARLVTPAHDPGVVAVMIQTADFRYAVLQTAFHYEEPTASSVVWNTPEPIVYGTPLGEAQLNATAPVAGTFVYTPAAGTLLPAGFHDVSVTFTPHDPDHGASTATVLLEVLKATPVVDVAGGTFTYDGAPHAASGSAVGVAGTPLSPVKVMYNGEPDAPVNAGDYGVVAVYAGDGNYNAAYATATLTIMKATPVIEVVGGTFTYDGTPHEAAASALGVADPSLSPLKVTYNGEPTAPVNAGDYGVVAVYEGNTNYNAASATATLTIVKATPTMSATGGTFTYDGQPHAATATAAGVGGVALAPLTFTYNGTKAIPVNAGSYAVTVSFNGNENYDPASATTTVIVDKAAAAVTVTSTSLTYDGLAHHATATGTGAAGEMLGPLSFTYSGLDQPPVDAGSYEVVATFAGDANHHAASGAGTLTIAKATPTVVVVGGTVTYNGGPHHAQASAFGVAGEALGPVQLTYNGAANAAVDAGTYAVNATYDGNANYRSASATATLTIAKAAPVITWPQPAAIVYGTALGAAQLNATASTAGTFTYSPAAGTVLTAGAGKTLFVSFTPTDTANYTAVSAMTVIAVDRAPLEIRAYDAIKKFAQPMPTFTASITGFVNGDSMAALSGTLEFATTATTHSLPGTYPIVPFGVGSSNYDVRFVNGTLTVYRGSNPGDDSWGDDRDR